MNNVNQYVNVMKQAGVKAAEANPNSEMSQLKRELIEYYKGNLLKAHATINSMVSTNGLSETQRAHYDAACIATGRTTALPATEFNFTPEYKLPTKHTEMNKLSQAGWQPLNESKPQLLNG